MKKLLTTLLISGITFSLISCTGGPSAEGEVKDFFKDLQTNNFEMADLPEVEGFSLEELEQEEKELLEKYPDEVKSIEKLTSNLVKNIDGKIVSSEEIENTATVNVDITAVDCSTLITGFLSDVFTEAFSTAFGSMFSGEELTDDTTNELMLKILEENLEELEIKTVEKNFTVELEKVEDEWVISNDEQLLLECMNIDSSILDTLENFNDLEESPTEDSDTI